MKHNLLFILCVFLLPTSYALADEPVRMISVTGEAKQELAPDQAILSGQIISKAKTLKAAKLANDKMANKVYEITKNFEIPKNKITASNVQINPEYVWDKDSNKRLKEGYIVSRNLSITMDKLEIHEEVLSALVEAGIEQINNVSFQIADYMARADTLRVQAIRSARVRAQMMADAAGAKLGKVITITMEGNSAPPPMMMRAAKAESMAMDAASSAPSLPGMNTLHERVSVTFELE